MKTLNNYIVIEDIAENKTANGLMISGVEAQNIRTQKAKVIISGATGAVENDDIIFYDSARSFTLVDSMWETPVKVIRINEVIVVISSHPDDGEPK